MKKSLLEFCICSYQLNNQLRNAFQKVFENLNYLKDYDLKNCEKMSLRKSCKY